MTRRFRFVNQYFVPAEAATGRILADVVAWLTAKGVTCEVIASDRSYADPRARFPRRATWQGAEVCRIATTGFGRGSRLRRVVDYATFLFGAGPSLLRRPRPDLIVGLSDPPILGAAVVLAARICGTRSVYWVMDLYPELAFALGVLRPGGLPGRLFSSISGWALRRADLVVTLGETMAGRLRDLGGRNVVAINNWADGSAIQPKVALMSRYRRERGWDEKLVVLYSGNMGLAYEFKTMVRAAERLRNISEIVFAFVGGGPRRSEVESEVHRLGLPNVEFHSAVPAEELADSLASGDLHVVSMAPGMAGLLVPSKLYGILAAGRPVVYVGPAEGEVFEIVSGGACGWCVSNGDAEGLARVVESVRANPSEARAAGARARTLFDDQFARDRQIKALADVLMSLLGESETLSRSRTGPVPAQPAQPSGKGCRQE
ncbi:MAG: glycosyltransferase family 4 protein [Thermoanaerobaculia bacterium]